MNRPPSRFVSALARCGALLVITTILVGVPLTVVHLIGLPHPGSWSLAPAGRLDERMIAEIGGTVFLLLWAWFACTVATEAVRVVRSIRNVRRRHHSNRGDAPRRVLPPTSSTPTGWVRRLVRVALVSSVAVAGSGGGRWFGASASAAAEPSRIEWQLPVDTAPSIDAGDEGPTDTDISAVDATATVHTLEADGRTTPYSLALSLGDAGLRDRVIELNLGASTPDGGSWSGGVFPQGMRVRLPMPLPAGSALWADHDVVRGDSVYGIAGELCDESLACVGEVADAIIDRNLGRTMEDGRVFHDPSLIVVGWSLDIPASGASLAVAEPVSEAAPAEAVPAETPAADLEPAAAAPVQPAPTEPAPTEPAPAQPAPAQPAPASTAPQTAPTPTVAPVAAPVTAAPSDRGPFTSSLGAAVLLCAGALGLVESRRRHQLRRAGTSAVAVPPSPQSVATERLLRALDTTERAVRIDLALRCVGHHLIGTGHHVRAVLCDDDGALTVVLDRPSPCRPPAEFDSLDDARWHLRAHVDTVDLADGARLAGQPCPTLVHLGTARDTATGARLGDLFVDLEAAGLLCIDGRPAEVEPVMSALAASLAASPVGECVRVVTHGLDPAVHLGNLAAESAESLDDALDRAAATLGSIPTITAGRRTFELRARGTGGEAWEPVVVLAALSPTDDATDVPALTRGGGRGLAVVVDRPLIDAGITMCATIDGWTIDALGVTVVPVGLERQQLHALHDLLDAAERPLPVAPPDAAQGHGPTSPSDAAPFVEPAWALMVRLLGQVSVVTSTGERVEFDRGKSLELLAWLGLHREYPTRSAARAALWDFEVRDATFANIVSDARRTLARAVAPAEGEEWIERTLTDHLPLHPLVVTDADLLRARLEASRRLDAADAIDVLRPGVASITDLPFAGTDFAWPDAEGSTTALTLLATSAATELAQHHLAVGDIDGVFWATGQGLRVLSGHEELIALRMRAFALRGDLAGVRREWEVYERSLQADSWSIGEPSPKLVAVRRELLSR
ncbi:MAG: bacterial transcriptional activator domain-containing protein [Actinomycetota bacterium]